MDEKALENLRNRTDSKLRYAEIHLDELRARGQGGGDFERAHMESFLYHLIGARDAFLVELIDYYSLGNIKTVSLGSIRDAIKTQGKSSEEYAELYSVDQLDETEWFYRAKNWRDHTTHKGPLRHHFSLHVGGGRATAGEVQLQDPATGERFERRELSDWLSKMRELLDRLRESAISKTNSRD